MAGGDEIFGDEKAARVIRTRQVPGAYFSTVFLDCICQLYLSTIFLKCICELYLSTVFVNFICELIRQLAGAAERAGGYQVPT